MIVTMPRVSEKFHCGMGDRKTFSTMIKKDSLVPCLEAEYNTPITPLWRDFQRLLREKKKSDELQEKLHTFSTRMNCRKKMNSCIRPSLLTTKVRPRPKIRLGQDGFAGWIEIPTRLRLNQRRNFPRCSSRGIDGKKPEHAPMRRELQEEEDNFPLSAERTRGILSKLAKQLLNQT